MAESVDKLPTLFMNSNGEVLNITDNIHINRTVNNFVEELEHLDYDINDDLYTNVIDNILNAELTLNNYEEIFRLKKFHAVELQPTPEENIKNIRYKDADGITIAIVQIYNNSNKIKIQMFGNIFPKQEFTSPEDVLNRILVRAEWAKWSTEDGGINQFDGNIETRYKNAKGHVMAAVITKSDGKTVDTIVEYQYKDDKKTGMLHTNRYGQSLTIYDGSNDISQLMSVDIDTDGSIYSITRGLD